MSQGALTVSDGSGLSVLAAINALAQRLATMASGTSRPADIAAGELWRETDNPGTGIHSIWLYDGASDVLVAFLDTATHAISLVSTTQSAGDNSTKVATTAWVLAEIANQAASQSEMEAGSSTSKIVTPGRVQFHPSAAKFWVRASTAGVIADSYNVTSVTDTGVGILDITINADFSSSSWLPVAAQLPSGASISVASSVAAGTVRLSCFTTFDGNTADPAIWGVVGFGDR